MRLTWSRPLVLLTGPPKWLYYFYAPCPGSAIGSPIGSPILMQLIWFRLLVLPSVLSFDAPCLVSVIGLGSPIVYLASAIGAPYVSRILMRPYLPSAIGSSIGSPISIRLIQSPSLGHALFDDQSSQRNWGLKSEMHNGDYTEKASTYHPWKVHFFKMFWVHAGIISKD